MFCPDCGKSDQTENTYCRQCGEFLPDSKNPKAIYTSENPKTLILGPLGLSFFSLFLSFSTEIILLLVFLKEENLPAVPLNFLIICYFGISILQAVNIYYLYKLAKKSGIIFFWEKKKDEQDKLFVDDKEKKNLPEADFSDIIPPSVTEHTTKQLQKNPKKSSES